MTKYLQETEASEARQGRRDLLKRVRESSGERVRSTIEEAVGGAPNHEHLQKLYLSYYEIRGKRGMIRRLRRLSLWIYYAVFTLLLAVLLLHSELEPAMYGVLADGAVSLDALTLWSLIVILFEIMMKRIVEKAVIASIDKRYGSHLSWYR